MSRIRVLTFNIRGANHDDGENIWERRKDLNVRTIKRHAPDLIGFQEMQEGNKATYDQELPEYRFVLGPKTENEPPHQRNAIYWNPSRLELLDHGGFWLSETPDTWSGSWDTRCIRAANWARFHLTDDGVELVYLNTHLDHISERARLEGSRLILRQLRTIAPHPVPILLTADFNCSPNSASHGLFLGECFADAHLATRSAPTNTFHGFRGDDFEPWDPDEEVRIDWILLRDERSGRTMEVHEYRVIRDAEPPIYPSDHYPVLAEISVPA